MCVLWSAQVVTGCWSLRLLPHLIPYGQVWGHFLTACSPSSLGRMGPSLLVVTGPLPLYIRQVVALTSQYFPHHYICYTFS